MFDICRAATDPKIPAITLGILAYLEGYSQSHPFCAPSRARILKDLSISKDTFYKYREPLLKYRYVKITPAPMGGKYPQNIYSCPAVQDTTILMSYQTGHELPDNVIHLMSWIDRAHYQLNRYSTNTLNFIGKHSVPGYTSPIINKQDDMKQAGR